MLLSTTKGTLKDIFLTIISFFLRMHYMSLKSTLKVNRNEYFCFAEIKISIFNVKNFKTIRNNNHFYIIF